MHSTKEEQFTTNRTNYEDDIPLDLATAAHAGTSMVPDERGAAERKQYAALLQNDREDLAKLATTDEKRALLDVEFARYRAGLRAKKLAQLRARSRVLSTLIAGPSNFNVRRNEKANRSEENRARELRGYRERALAAIRKKIAPELGPIMTGDADAAERLSEKLHELEAHQDLMRSVNLAIRKHAKAGPEAQVKAIVAEGLSEATARKAIEQDMLGRVGFPDYELKNNSANIRRVRARLDSVERAKTTPDSSFEGVNARVEDSPSENRVRLYFPGKPDAETRMRLKQSGFHWASSSQCWSAYRNDRTLAMARAVAGEPEASTSPAGPSATSDEGSDGTIGQDRDSYTDTQDRRNYTTDTDREDA